MRSRSHPLTWLLSAICRTKRPSGMGLSYTYLHSSINGQREQHGARPCTSFSALETSYTCRRLVVHTRTTAFGPSLLHLTCHACCTPAPCRKRSEVTRACCGPTGTGLFAPLPQDPACKPPGQQAAAHLWLMHSLRMYLHSERPSPVRPAIAMPMWSSILNTLRWKEDSSDCERFSVASTTCVSLCVGRQFTNSGGRQRGSGACLGALACMGACRQRGRSGRPVHGCTGLRGGMTGVSAAFQESAIPTVVSQCGTGSTGRGSRSGLGSRGCAVCTRGPTTYTKRRCERLGPAWVSVWPRGKAASKDATPSLLDRQSQAPQVAKGAP